jgi:hypothetical protein
MGLHVGKSVYVLSPGGLPDCGGSGMIQGSGVTAGSRERGEYAKGCVKDKDERGTGKGIHSSPWYIKYILVGIYYRPIDVYSALEWKRLRAFRRNVLVFYEAMMWER